jgi:phage terminase small subunit
MPNLTDKQQLFVDEYIIDLNATKAAIRAKYSAKTAKEIGFENLTKPHIAKAIQNAMAARSKRTEVNADYVLKRLVEIDEMDVLDILNDDGSVKKITDWPKCWRVTISSIDISELFDYQDGKKELSGLLKKIKWPDKVKNLELLGKHTNVQAFKEVIKHEGEIDMLSPLIAARKRIESRNKQ